MATTQISQNLFHYGTCGSTDHAFLLLCIITYQSIHFMSLTKFGNSQDSAPKQNLFPLLLLSSAEWLPTSPQGGLAPGKDLPSLSLLTNVFQPVTYISLILLIS